MGIETKIKDYPGTLVRVSSPATEKRLLAEELLFNLNTSAEDSGPLYSDEIRLRADVAAIKKQLNTLYPNHEVDVSITATVRKYVDNPLYKENVQTV